jgi:hypothetical protein
MKGAAGEFELGLEGTRWRPEVRVVMESSEFKLEAQFGGGDLCRFCGIEKN